MIRCIPGEDKTNGFFVSCFVRQSAGDKSASSSIGGKAGKRKRGVPLDAHAAAGGRGPELAEDNVKGGTAGSEDSAAAEAEAEDADEADEAFKDEALAPKAKTAAQAERARRKKAAQKKRRKIEIAA